MDHPTRIILEGTDQCGKTQIAHELSRVLGVPYFKNRREFRAFMDDDSDYFVNTVRYAEPYFIDFVTQAKLGFVLDRGFPSEFAYSKLFGRRTDLATLKKVDEMHAAIGTVVVVPRRSSYVGRRDDDSLGKIDSNRMEILDGLYRQFLEWTSCRSLTLYVDDECLSREVDEILEFLHCMK